MEVTLNLARGWSWRSWGSLGVVVRLVASSHCRAPGIERALRLTPAHHVSAADFYPRDDKS